MIESNVIIVEGNSRHRQHKNIFHLANRKLKLLKSKMELLKDHFRKNDDIQLIILIPIQIQCHS